MKTMTTGSDLKVNDKGSPLLRKHHAVDVEDGGSGVGRAVVKDQLFIDHLLIKDMIDVHQHMEAERVINLAVSAQVYLKSPSMDSISHGGGQTGHAEQRANPLRWLHEVGGQKVWA